MVISQNSDEGKYLVGFCFPSCLLAGALKACGKGQMFALVPVPQVCALLCPQGLCSQP